jgi:hypothetical protein
MAAPEMPGQLVLWGLPPDFLWGRPARVEIPEPFWSDDWFMGIRSKTYLGEICSHSGPESEVCVQPERKSQAEGMQPPCIPFDPDTATITVLPGKLRDYL